MERSKLGICKVKNRDLLIKIGTNHPRYKIRQYEKLKFYPTSERCADPHLFFLLINPQYMYGIRVNNFIVEHP